MTSPAVGTPPRLLRIGEVSELLGVPRWRLYALNQKGLGPPSFRLGKVVVFPQHLLVRWIDAQCERPAAEPVATEQPQQRRKKAGQR